MTENDRAERHSSGSSTTIAEGDHERMRRRRSDELGEPSDKRYKRAGMAGALASGAGGAGATALAQSGDSEPHGWRDVQVDDKHHIWSGKVSGSRKSALKVGLSLLIPVDVRLLMAESPAALRIHHRLALDLPPDLLGIKLQAHAIFPQSRGPPRLLRYLDRGIPQSALDGDGEYAGWLTGLADAFGLERTPFVGLSGWAGRCSSERA